MHAILIANQVGQINVLIAEPTDWAKWFFHIPRTRPDSPQLVWSLQLIHSVVINNSGDPEVFDFFRVMKSEPLAPILQMFAALLN